MINTISTQANKLINLTKRKQKINPSSTKLLTITSGKGGVGKSTFTANIASLLAKRGLKVAVIDADIGLANMQVLFDVKPTLTLFEYIDGKANLEEVFIQTKYPNITLIAGKSGYQYSKHSNSLVLARIVQDVIDIEIFDIVLIDTGAGLNDYVKEFLSISGNILALTTTDPSALTDVYALMKMLSKDKNSLMLSFNHTKNYKIGESITNSLQNLALKNRLNPNFMIEYIGNVSSSKNISTTGRLRKLFVNEFEDQLVTRELEFIVSSLLKKLNK
ncbi:Cobyrinic acid ac-diamide synthase [Arcobacter nitrofigilis DSM 7299]|uniref:Cobyrinic acid ac-diamide synthase n=1 Tax=Arcobacter nitrofigilis (strain ATCC 33309 / DSM 7299 / CCUG 15893 / LMG 7604 / NCTC 12251 / CI) TaxID=572480 RepID=D5UZ82_ARCNC|nr:AAA family ATPase [Arcobacter nitrofigilis]ADG94134.1 Cobyrinic acid ac-diamide synthase [Arcobacter nitrofigilis DSM 7299]